MKSKQEIVPLSAPPAGVLDEETETLRDQVLPNGYSVSEPLDVEDAEFTQDPMDAQVWEDAGLGWWHQSHPCPRRPVTMMLDVDIPATFHKHAASSFLVSEAMKSQKMDADQRLRATCRG